MKQIQGYCFLQLVLFKWHMHLFMYMLLDHYKCTLLFQFLFLASLFQNHQKPSPRQVKRLISLQLCVETWQPAYEILGWDKFCITVRFTTWGRDCWYLGMTHFSPQALDLLLAGTGPLLVCFPHLWIVLCELLLSCLSSHCELFWVLALVCKILSLVLFLGSSNCILFILLAWWLTLLSWLLILTWPCIISSLSV